MGSGWAEGARLLGRVGGGALGAALGAFLVLKLKEARLQAAVTKLWALLASKADPSILTAAEVGAHSTPSPDLRQGPAATVPHGGCEQYAEQRRVISK